MKKGCALLLLLGMGSLSGMNNLFGSGKKEAPKGRPRTSSSTSLKMKKGRSAEEMKRRRASSNLSKSPSSSTVALLSRSAPIPIEQESTLTARIKNQSDELLRQLRDDTEDEGSTGMMRKRALSNTSREGLSLQERFEDGLRSDNELWSMYLELDREKLREQSDPTESIARERETIACQMELNQTLQLLHDRLRGVENNGAITLEQLESLIQDFNKMKETIEKQDKQLTGLCKILTRGVMLVVREQTTSNTSLEMDRDISEKNNFLGTMNAFLKLLSGDSTELIQPS